MTIPSTYDTPFQENGAGDELFDAFEDELVVSNGHDRAPRAAIDATYADDALPDPAAAAAAAAAAPLPAAAWPALMGGPFQRGRRGPVAHRTGIEAGAQRLEALALRQPAGLLRMQRQFFQEDRQANVKYVGDDERRRKYLVTLGARLLRRGIELDTSEVTKAVRNRKGWTLAGFHHGRSRTGAKLELPKAWEHPLMWVCLPDDHGGAQFFSHIAKRGHFHHSSFASGGGVIGAGEWIVERGRLRSVSANSGHYRTSMDHFYRSVLLMTEAFQPDTTVLLYDTTADQWVERPVLKFKESPTKNGRYKVHPMAP